MTRGGRQLSLVFCGVLGLAASSCTSAGRKTPTTSSETIVDLQARSAIQVGKRKGSNLTIESVRMPIAGGFVVVYANVDGVPGKVLGSRPLTVGSHKNIEVDVADSSNNDVWVIVHEDRDHDGIFTPDVDVAVDDPVTGVVIGDLSK